MKILVVDDNEEIKLNKIRTEIRNNEIYSEYVMPFFIEAAMDAACNSIYFPPEKKKVKCLLPECDNLTDHNGGYCCAEHCKQHRKTK